MRILNETEISLAWMCMQYCTNCTNIDYENEVFDHSFMSAGENAFTILGIKNGDNVSEFRKEYNL